MYACNVIVLCITGSCYEIYTTQQFVPLDIILYSTYTDSTLYVHARIVAMHVHVYINYNQFIHKTNNICCYAREKRYMWIQAIVAHVYH